MQNSTDIINSKNEENKLLNDQIVVLQADKDKLQADLENVNEKIVSLNGIIEEKETIVVECKSRIKALEEEVIQLKTSVSELQLQADLKLDEVKNIVEDLKGLIANA